MSQTPRHVSVNLSFNIDAETFLTVLSNNNGNSRWNTETLASFVRTYSVGGTLDFSVVPIPPPRQPVLRLDIMGEVSRTSSGPSLVKGKDGDTAPKREAAYALFNAGRSAIEQAECLEDHLKTILTTQSRQKSALREVTRGMATKMKQTAQRHTETKVKLEREVIVLEDSLADFERLLVQLEQRASSARTRLDATQLNGDINNVMRIVEDLQRTQQLIVEHKKDALSLARKIKSVHLKIAELNTTPFLELPTPPVIPSLPPTDEIIAWVDVATKNTSAHSPQESCNDNDEVTGPQKNQDMILELLQYMNVSQYQAFPTMPDIDE